MIALSGASGGAFALERSKQLRQRIDGMAAPAPARSASGSMVLSSTRLSMSSTFHANSPSTPAPTRRPEPFSVWNERRMLISDEVCVGIGQPDLLGACAGCRFPPAFPPGRSRGYRRRCPRRWTLKLVFAASASRTGTCSTTSSSTSIQSSSAVRARGSVERRRRGRFGLAPGAARPDRARVRRAAAPSPTNSSPRSLPGNRLTDSDSSGCSSCSMPAPARAEAPVGWQPGLRRRARAAGSGQ